MDFSMMASTVLGALIAVGSAAVLQHCVSKRERKVEYRRQMVCAYDDLSEALFRYCRECVELTMVVMDEDNADEIVNRCRLAYLGLQHAFRKPLLAREDCLQQDLDRISGISDGVMADIIEIVECNECRRVDDGFLEELFGTADDVNMFLNHLMRKAILGPEYKVDEC